MKAAIMVLIAGRLRGAGGINVSIPAAAVPWAAILMAALFQNKVGRSRCAPIGQPRLLADNGDDKIGGLDRHRSRHGTD
jgi:hypothetical protein